MIRRISFGTVLSMAIMSGCAERAANDNFTPDSLSPSDQQILTANRYGLADGGALVRVRFPQYVYRNGALVDTGGVNWFYLGRNAVFYDDFIPISGPPQSPPPISGTAPVHRSPSAPVPDSSAPKGPTPPAASEDGVKSRPPTDPITNEQGH